MMLAGIVLTISFILTALTLSQVASLEKEAAREAGSPIIGEWRFLHDRLTSSVKTAVAPETTNQSFNDTVLPALGATFRALAAEKGYDLIVRKAGGDNYAGNGNEASLVTAGKYATWSHDGAVDFNALTVDVDLTDGILWQKPCPDPDGGPAAGCISGVYLFIRLADATTTVEGSVLFAVNHG